MEMKALFEAVELAEEQQQRLSEAASLQRMHVHHQTHPQQPRGDSGLAVCLEPTLVAVAGYEAPSPSTMRIHDILNSEQDDDDDDRTLHSTQRHTDGGAHAYNQHAQQVAHMRFHWDQANGNADMPRHGGDARGAQREENNTGSASAPMWWLGASTTTNAPATNATIRDEVRKQNSKPQQPRGDGIGPSGNGSMGARLLLLNECAAPPPSSSIGAHSMPVNPSRGGMRKKNAPMENVPRTHPPPAVAQPRPNLRIWTPEEKEAFWNGYRIHGPNWKAIEAEFVTTRTAKQISAFARRSESPASVKEKAPASGAPSAASRQPAGQRKVVVATAAPSDLIARVPAPPKAASTTAHPAQEAAVAPQQDSCQVLDLSGQAAAGDTSSQQRPQRATRPRKNLAQQLAADENEGLAAIISSMINAPEPQQRDAHEAMPTESAANVAVMAGQVTEQQQTKPRRTSRQGKKTLKARESAAMMNNNSNAVAAKSVPPRLAFEGITVTDDSRHSSSSVSSWTENHSVIEIFTEEETPEKKTKRSNKLQQVPIRSKRNAQRPSWAMQSPILQKKPKITGKNAVAGGPARGKKRRQRPELDASAIVPGDGRPCDFCHKTQGVCALMHCAACRRAYHAKCFVGHFRPHCKTHATAESEDVVPIEQQIAALQLNPPDNVRVTIFRCGPCHAAFIEFFNSGGYEWDCECPSCKEPDKLIAYRRQMLLKIMLNEDDPKKKSKGTAAARKQVKSSEDMYAENAPQDTKKTAARGGGSRATLLRRTGSRRRAALLSAAASDESEAMVVDSAEEIAVATVQLAEAQERRSKALRRDEHTAKANEDGDGDGAGDDDAEPEQENDMIDKAGDSAETPADVEPKPELSEDEQLLAAVTIKFDSGRDCFDIVCVVDTSTGESIKKTGLYFVKQRELPPRRAEREDVNEEEEREPKGESVYCYCCSKDLTLAQFVRHSTTPTPSISAGFFTANPLLPEAAAAIADPRACLFVCHHDGIGLTPLVKFLNVLQKRQRTATTAVGGSPAKNKMQRKPSLSDTLAEARQTLTEAVISRRYMATKSPRNVAQMYAIKLVCLSKKLMVQMPDKVMQSTMDPSMQLDYPYKEGWLSFDAGIAPRNADSKPPTMSTVQCSCCKQDMALDAFIVHTKLEDWSPKFKRRFVHVPQVGNERKLVELEKIWQAVITLYQHRRLDQVLQQKVQAIER